MRGNVCGAAGSVRDIVIMGHSMGGLIARELAQDPRVSSCMKSVVEVSSPNQGATIADFAIEHATAEDTGFDFYQGLVNVIGFTPDHKRTSRNFERIARRIPRRNKPRSFDAQDLADNPAVQYFSISSSYSKNPLEILEPISVMRGITSDELTQLKLDQTSYGTLNDGIVPEYSQIHGTYLGHLESHSPRKCLHGRGEIHRRM